MMKNLTVPTDLLTPADLLAAGLHLPDLPDPPVELPPGATCVATGQPIARGYPVASVITESTAEFLDAFRGRLDGFVSVNAARCYKSADPRKGNLCARSVVAFADGPLYNPLIARESAIQQGRPCWSDLVRAIWPARSGQRCLLILTTDTKKRLWIRARVGALGARTPVLCYDSETAVNEVLYLDWPALVACLDAIEPVYSAGFPKAALRQSLYLAGSVAQQVGLARTRVYEATCAAWRKRPEFAVAALIAQKAPVPSLAAAPALTQEENDPCQPALF